MRAVREGDGRQRLKMKDLERATGVGREAIRFYIREGLLPEPERPARNVAFYDESCVGRIRLIKELQQKRYLPLHVIKLIVAGDASPSPREVEALLQLDGRLSPRSGDGGEVRSERLSALAARIGVPVREIRDLAAAEAIDIVTRDGDQWLDGAAVRFVELWAEARRAGFTAARGFGPEQVRLYVDMVRLLAREELRLFTRTVGGGVDADEAVRMAEQGLELGSQLIALLRRAMLLRLIAEGSMAAEPAERSRRGSDAS